MSFTSMPFPGNPRIRIDIPSDLLNVDKFEEELPGTVMDIALEARTFWESEAGRRLTSSRDKYQKAIALEQAGDAVDLYLGDKFAVDVEMGKEPFSLRELFMKSDKLKDGPVKVPKALRNVPFVPTGRAKATRWMIVPLNVERQAPFSSPSTFRIFTDAQPASMWKHPGFKGVNIAETVASEIANEIAPKHIEKLIDKLMR